MGQAMDAASAGRAGGLVADEPVAPVDLEGPSEASLPAAPDDDIATLSHSCCLLDYVALSGFPLSPSPSRTSRLTTCSMLSALTQVWSVCPPGPDHTPFPRDAVGLVIN